MKLLRILVAVASLILGLAAQPLSAQDLENLRQKKPIRLSSGLSFSMGAYQSSGIVNRQMPFNYMINGSPVLEIYGVRLPFSITYSNQQRSFQQPFNQFGLTPTWKWIKLHLGYSNVRFSSYTLAGRRFLGAGIELTPGKFRFGFVKGRFQKYVPFDSTAVQLPGQLPFAVPVPAYSRYGYAAKIGVGGRRSFVDLSYLKAEDRLPDFSERQEVPNLKPQENAVLGINAQITFFKKLVWKTEGAVSAYTRDSEADSLPIGTTKAADFIRKIVTPTITTQVFTAMESSLAYRGKVAGLRLLYKRIDPDFKSMGAFFFQTDIKQYTIAPSLYLRKIKLNLNGSLGWQENNLSGVRYRTTRRLIHAGTVSWSLGKRFGIYASYGNYGMTQTPRATLPGFRPDTLQLVQVSRNIVFSPRFTLGDRSALHTLSMSVNFNQIDDQRISTAINSTAANFSWQFNKEKRYTIQTSLILQNSKAPNSDSRNLGGSMNYQRHLLKGKVSSGLQLALYAAKSDQAGKGYTLQAGWNSQYKFHKKGSFFLRIYHLRSDQSLRAFSEWYGNTGLGWSF